MLEFLKGKKTYLVALIACLGALVAYLTGEMSAAQAANAVIVAIIGTTVRAGSKNDALAVIESVAPPAPASIDQVKI